MISTRVILLGLLIGSAFGNVPLPSPYTEHCIIGEKNEYVPSKLQKVPTFRINLDDPPLVRWNQVATQYASGIRDLISVIKNMTFPFFHGKLIQFVDRTMGGWDAKLKQPHRDELKGIANATGLPLGEVVLFAAFYEVNAVCTSIVAEDTNGKLFQARNLDFGLFLGWDTKTHDWAITEKLRKLIINVDWYKGGKLLYRSNQFAGYTGVYNAVKQGVMTISANERYDLKGGYVGLINWLLGIGDAQWMTWAVRDVVEQATSYSEAVKTLQTIPLMSPVYFIVGGTKPKEATIIARELDGIAIQTYMNETDPNGWYVLETNYDHKKAPLFIDDRRTPGNECMKKLGSAGVSFKGLFNVLSSTTNYNKLTTYTCLMSVDSGVLETYVRKCPDPCWPW